MSELSYVFLCTLLKDCLFLLPIIHSKYLSEFHSISLYPLFSSFCFPIFLYSFTLLKCAILHSFLFFSLSLFLSLSISLSLYLSLLYFSLTKLWNCKMSGVERLKLNWNNESVTKLWNRKKSYETEKKIMKEQKKVMKQSPKSWGLAWLNEWKVIKKWEMSWTWTSPIQNDWALI